MFFSVTTKNLNWEVLTKNLVTFRGQDEIKDEKFYYYRDSLKNLIYMGGGEGFHEKPMYRWGLPEKRSFLAVCRFKEGGLGKKEGGCL